MVFSGCENGVPEKIGGLSRAGNVARMEGGRSVFKILTTKPIGKRPLRRPKCGWEDTFRIDLK